MVPLNPSAPSLRTSDPISHRTKRTLFLFFSKESPDDPKTKYIWACCETVKTLPISLQYQHRITTPLGMDKICFLQ